MAPLPPLWDPARAVDKLPQPYRMLDKLVGEIIEKAVSVCFTKSETQRIEAACKVPMSFTPHAVLKLPGDSTCFHPVGLGGCLVAGAEDGSVSLQSARFPGASEVDVVHDSPVLAVTSGHNVPLFVKLAASVSRQDVALHAIHYKTNKLQRLAKVPLPLEAPSALPPPEASTSGGTASSKPSAAATAAAAAAAAPIAGPAASTSTSTGIPLDDRPCSLHFSPNACHLAVCYRSGAAAVYRVDVAGLVDNITVDGVSVIDGATLTLLVHLSAAALRGMPGMFPSGTAIGASRVLWALQQRPDRSGRSDAYHKAAYGVYVWWQGCDRIMLCKFSDGEPPPTPPSASAPAASVLLPPAPVPPPAAAASPAVVPPAAAALLAAAAAQTLVIRAPSGTWLVPHPILCACSTSDGVMQAFGLGDGSIVIWSDPFGGPVKVLPRLSSAVTSLTYVNLSSEKLMAASEDGRLVVLDLAKPEDSSQKEVQLPLPVAGIIFLPSDPLAICVCQTTASRPGVPPRFLWYHTDEERLVAELVAPASEGFGTAGLHPVNSIYPPTPPPLPSAASSSSSSAVAPPNAVASRDPSPVPPAVPPLATAAGGTTAAPSASGLVFKPPPQPPAAESLAHLAFPSWAVRDSYLVMGGHIKRTDGDEWTAPTCCAEVYMFKLDAVAHKVLPDTSLASKMLLNNALVEMEPQKRRKGKKVRVAMDKDEPQLKSAMRGRHGSEDGAGDESGRESRPSSRGSSRLSSRESSSDGTAIVPIRLKITFTDLDHVSPAKKVASKTAKPTVVEGFHGVTAKGTGRVNQDGSATTERPRSPPWHHTNPTARIHPDWEEAGHLTRMMERLTTKGGGRRRREKKLLATAEEMMERFAREKGAKHNLLVT